VNLSVWKLDHWEFRPKYFQNYAAFFAVDKHEDMTATFAEPIMPHAVNPMRQISR
jgi:hypothetical protein